MDPPRTAQDGQGASERMGAQPCSQGGGWRGREARDEVTPRSCVTAQRAGPHTASRYTGEWAGPVFPWKFLLSRGDALSSLRVLRGARA